VVFLLGDDGSSNNLYFAVNIRLKQQPDDGRHAFNAIGSCCFSSHVPQFSVYGYVSGLFVACLFHSPYSTL